MSNKDFVLQRNAFAEKRMAADFAAPANLDALLDFHKGADFDLIADFTPVEIGKAKYTHVPAEFYIGGNAIEFR